MNYMTMRQFKSAVRRKEVPATRDLCVRKLFVDTPQVLTETDESETDPIRFTITTAAVDREKDVVSLDGWQLENFQKNPVVLWGHQSYEPPVGRSVNLFFDGGALKSDVQFVPADVPIYGVRAQGIRQMCRMGFLSATSVGFRPLEFEVANDRDEEDTWFPPLNFLRQELMELSIVTIPCNPEALIDAPDAAGQAAQLAARIEQEAAAAAEREAALIALRLGRTQRQHQARRIAFA